MILLACIALGSALYRWRGHGKVSGLAWGLQSERGGVESSGCGGVEGHAAQSLLEELGTSPRAARRFRSPTEGKGSGRRPGDPRQRG